MYIIVPLLQMDKETWKGAARIWTQVSWTRSLYPGVWFLLYVDSPRVNWVHELYVTVKDAGYSHPAGYHSRALMVIQAKFREVCAWRTTAWLKSDTAKKRSSSDSHRTLSLSYFSFFLFFILTLFSWYQTREKNLVNLLRSAHSLVCIGMYHSRYFLCICIL